jgi:Na+-transporting methylmalonyl-CoA/oxaloacetate decarboxylase gamma subunit
LLDLILNFFFLDLILNFFFLATEGVGIVVVLLLLLIINISIAVRPIASRADHQVARPGRLLLRLHP